MDVIASYYGMTETQDINSIVRKCQSGDREAFGILYQTYIESLRRVVSYYINNQEVVWDILHDGFLIAFASISSLKSADKVEAWLTTIMKNLALQFLKEEQNRTCIPLSDENVEYTVPDEEPDKTTLTWEELSHILDRLPEGYGKIFRLAVLDGLSHKEISEILGIAPHSSSSQLTHAKAMLRRMIRQYRIEMGLLSVAVIFMIVWHFMPGHEESKPSAPALSKNKELVPSVSSHAKEVIVRDNNNGNITPANIHRTVHESASPASELTAEIVTEKDSTDVAITDSVPEIDKRTILNLYDNLNLTARQEVPVTKHVSNSGWRLSLSYSAIVTHINDNRYRNSDMAIAGPGDPPEEPVPDTKVVTKTHHKMPVIIGLSLNKALTSRWSLETGVRYTFMESDYLSENKQWKKRTNQQIHYIGIPLKFNYRIFTVRGFSMYGHGGGALDIPVSGRQSVWKLSPYSSTPHTEKFNIHPRLQWSVEGGLGIQYNFTPSFSIFAEPSINYYFKPGGDIETIRQEKPFDFTLPVGLRLTW